MGKNPTDSTKHQEDNQPRQVIILQHRAISSLSRHNGENHTNSDFPNQHKKHRQAEEQRNLKAKSYSKLQWREIDR